MSVFWVNVNKTTGVWKLHKESCRFCNPHETSLKGINQMKKDGGWFEFKSYQSAYEVFQTDHIHLEYWQPCRNCNPE